MQKKVFDRRRELVRIMTRGVPLRDAVKRIMEKFDVEEHVVRNDWTRRKTWMPQVIELEDDTLLHEVVAGLKEIIPMAWLIYSQAKGNMNARIGALKLAKDTYVDLLKILQSVGAVEQAPTEIAGQILQTHVDWEKLTEDERNTIIKSARIRLKDRSKKQP